MLGALSAEEACELHRQMVLWTTRTLVRSKLGPVRMAVEGDRGDPLFETCRALGAADFRRQVGNGLGQRMAHAVSFVPVCGCPIYRAEESA